MKKLHFVVFMLLCNVNALLTKDGLVKVGDMIFGKKGWAIDPCGIMSPYEWEKFYSLDLIKKGKLSLQEKINYAGDNDDLKNELTEQLSYMNAMFPKDDGRNFLNVWKEETGEDPITFVLNLAICYFNMDPLRVSRLVRQPLSVASTNIVLNTGSGPGNELEVTIHDVIMYFYKEHNEESFNIHEEFVSESKGVLMSILLYETLTDDTVEDFFKTLYTEISRTDGFVPGFVNRHKSCLVKVLL